MRKWRATVEVYTCSCKKLLLNVVDLFTCVRLLVNQTRRHLNSFGTYTCPFFNVNVDCVGTLLKTKGRNQYLLTITVCVLPIASQKLRHLLNIKAPNIAKALSKFLDLSRSL